MKQVISDETATASITWHASYTSAKMDASMDADTLHEYHYSSQATEIVDSIMNAHKHLNVPDTWTTTSHEPNSAHWQLTKYMKATCKTSEGKAHVNKGGLYQWDNYYIMEYSSLSIKIMATQQQ